MKKRRRTHIGKSVLISLSGCQNHRCCYCGRHAPLPSEPCDDREGIASIEHYLPVSQGGSDKPSNLAMACRRCNSRRGHLPVELFLDLRLWEWSIRRLSLLSTQLFASRTGSLEALRQMPLVCFKERYGRACNYD